jgi:hypothetical protein
VRFEIEGYLLFLAFVGQYCPDEQNQTIWRNTVVQLQPLLSTGDRGQHRQSVDPGLDVRRSTVFLRQHGRDTGDLILGIEGGGVGNQWAGDTGHIFWAHLWRDDETDHRGSRSKETLVSEDFVRRDGGEDGRHPLAASRLLISFLTFHI